MSHNQTKPPLLLNSSLPRFLWEPPFDRPQYNGRHHIGIMRQKCNRRVIWRFVYRGDGQPMFNTWFDEARHFSHGYAAVRLREKWQFIASDGKSACRHRFLEVGMVDSTGQVLVLHPLVTDLHTKLPVCKIYTLPSFMKKYP